MCGIAGFVAKHGRMLSNSLILKMVSLINHRGPDDEGFMILKGDNQIVPMGGENTPAEVWETDTEYRPTDEILACQGEKSVLAFGHKRLSILDLSPAGHQPLSYQNGRYWIIYNGEIYNHLDIRKELEMVGHHFTTKTDTEIILAAYSEWGENCMSRFVGMWAFAIFDKTINEIFIARDRYGIKPLYYYFSPHGDFFFASEIKQFTVLPSWYPAMNPQRVYDQIIYSMSDHTDETMFKDVFQLPGGTYFKSKLDCIKPTVYGKVNYTKWYKLKRDPFNGTFDEAASIFRTLFEVSLKEHLNADVPVGTALSGGLDSSSIVCGVNRILRDEGTTDRQRTFSSCSEIEKYSEKKWIDIIVGETNVNASFIFPKVEAVFKLTPEIVWYQDEPYQSQSAFLGYNVFKLAASEGVKVLLNGQGADEYLGGYGQFIFSRYSDMVKKLKIGEIIDDIRNLKKIRPVSNVELLKGVLYHLLPTRYRHILSRLSGNTSYIKSLIDINKLGIDFKHPLNAIPVEYSSVSNISEHLTFYSTLPKYLHWEDRNSMASSVEARVPFLDHRLVNFAYNLPDNFLDCNGVTKRVMRHAMSNLLPETIRDRKDKMGFATPEEHWVRNESSKLFRKGIAQTIDITNGLIKNDALLYFDKIVEGKVPFDYTYWRMILLGEWVKKFQLKVP
jgi:asparagine synthase (glutamine-hydrolysing)